MYIKHSECEMMYNNILDNIDIYQSLNEILKSQFDLKIIHSIQSERLNKVIQTAYSKTKFYKKSFDSVNFKGDCINRESLAKLPILSKKDIKIISLT